MPENATTTSMEALDEGAIVPRFGEGAMEVTVAIHPVLSLCIMTGELRLALKAGEGAELATVKVQRRSVPRSALVTRLEIVRSGGPRNVAATDFGAFIRTEAGLLVPAIAPEKVMKE